VKRQRLLAFFLCFLITRRFCPSPGHKFNIHTRDHAIENGDHVTVIDKVYEK
jgi:hypothetical protein